MTTWSTYRVAKRPLSSSPKREEVEDIEKKESTKAREWSIENHKKV